MLSCEIIRTVINMVLVRSGRYGRLLRAVRVKGALRVNENNIFKSKKTFRKDLFCCRLSNLNCIQDCLNSRSNMTDIQNLHTLIIIQDYQRLIIKNHYFSIKLTSSNNNNKNFHTNYLN